MPLPTRAACDVTDSEELFVWDHAAKEWRCNDCGALKTRALLVRVNMKGERSTGVTDRAARCAYRGKDRRSGRHARGRTSLATR